MLTQSKYLIDLLQQFNMMDFKAINTLTTLGKQLSKSKGNLLADPTTYRSLVGGLQYLTLMQSDLAFVVNQVYKYMHLPTDQHMTATKHIL